MLIASALLAAAGLGLFGVYFMTGNIAVGGPSIFMILGGIIGWKYFWSKADNTVNEYIGEVNKKQVNSFCIYENEIKFEDVCNPQGFPWECLNDHKKYFVNIWDVETKRLLPFTLPDQQYYDPTVFAERVLALPAHRRIFMRKEKLFQKLKTALLVVAILIVWLLILTTTTSGA